MVLAGNGRASQETRHASHVVHPTIHTTATRLESALHMPIPPVQRHPPAVILLHGSD